MPTVSRFYGITITMYFNDHSPPHFHAPYGDDQAVVVIATGEILRGDLPARALSLVREWAAMHRRDLDANWARIQQPTHPLSIDPLP